jgi:PAS domain S-box-containing protein
MDGSSNVDDLRLLVQQLQAENADLKNQVAALQQAQLSQSASTVRSHAPANPSLPEPTSQFEAFMAHAPALAWLTDAQGVMGYANPAWLALMGVTAQQTIGQPLEALVPAELAQTYRQNNQWVIDHQAVLETTEQALLPDGTTRTFLVRKFLVQQPEEAACWVGGIGVDITDLKQAEAALRDSEARWQFALEGAGDGLWDWNAQTNYVYFSRQWKAMLGYDDHEVGTSLDEWDSRVHPDDKADCYADLERHFSGEIPVYQNEHRVRCKDGSYR